LARMNGGQIIVDYLIQENVAHAFGLCGHGNISFIDALYERSREIFLLRPPRVRLDYGDFYWAAGRPAVTFTCSPGFNIPISATLTSTRFPTSPLPATSPRASLTAAPFRKPTATTKRIFPRP
jgi:hypothetical protein